MATIRVSIVDPSNTKVTEAEVPDNVAMQRLIPALVSRMGLPMTDQRLQPISYRLGYTRAGVEAEILNEQTLAEAGLEGGERIRLYADMQAGGGDVLSFKHANTISDSRVEGDWRPAIAAALGAAARALQSDSTYDSNALNQRMFLLERKLEDLQRLVNSTAWSADEQLLRQGVAEDMLRILAATSLGMNPSEIKATRIIAVRFYAEDISAAARASLERAIVDIAAAAGFPQPLGYDG